MGNSQELRNPELLTDIVHIAKRITPRVDEVVRALYPPLDPRLLEARSVPPAPLVALMQCDFAPKVDSAVLSPGQVLVAGAVRVAPRAGHEERVSSLRGPRLDRPVPRGRRRTSQGQFDDEAVETAVPGWVSERCGIDMLCSGH